MKKETGKEWLHGRRKRIAVVVVLAAAGAIAWLILSLFSGAKEVGFEQVPEDELPEAITSDIIPEYKTLERALACCIDDDIYVIVTRGEKPTSGFKVAVDHMALEEQDGKSTLIVYAGFKDPDKKTHNVSDCGRSDGSETASRGYRAEDPVLKKTTSQNLHPYSIKCLSFYGNSLQNVEK